MKSTTNIEAVHSILPYIPRRVVQEADGTSAFYDEVQAPPIGARVTIHESQVSFFGNHEGWSYSGRAKKGPNGSMGACILKVVPTNGH